MSYTNIYEVLIKKRDKLAKVSFAGDRPECMTEIAMQPIDFLCKIDWIKFRKKAEIKIVNVENLIEGDRVYVYFTGDTKYHENIRLIQTLEEMKYDYYALKITDITKLHVEKEKIKDMEFPIDIEELKAMTEIRKFKIKIDYTIEKTMEEGTSVIIERR